MFDYDDAFEYRETNLVKVTFLLNGKAIECLAMVAHKSKAEARARHFTSKLKQHIDRQLFSVAIQASVGGRIVARDDVPAMRKDVLARCSGGDITRKRKLLEKQKEGKKKAETVWQHPVESRINSEDSQ